jgi:hypothetical protein
MVHARDIQEVNLKETEDLEELSRYIDCSRRLDN